MRLRFLTLVIVLLALAGASTATAGPGLFVGAADDRGRTADPVIARAQMDLARLAGLDAIRVTTVWPRGGPYPDDGGLASLKVAAQMAALDGIQLIVTIMPYGSRTTPVTPRARAQFAAYAATLADDLPGVDHFIIGNEPNLNRYWLPQFGPHGSDAAAKSYERLLAQTYDAIKAVAPSVQVIGGSVSPRGSDNPKARRRTHSPTSFILDLGRAYRASGRRKPIMDAFAIHPYGESSSVSPALAHTRSTSIGLGDYDKLVGLLGQAFDGTAQQGSTLPILYDEYGVQSRIPASKDDAYNHLKIRTGRDAVTEKRQAAYYREAIRLAACQPNVEGILIFHTVDERDLDRWQSGLFYADETPKSSLASVRAAAFAARANDVVCDAEVVDDDTATLRSDTSVHKGSAKR